MTRTVRDSAIMLEAMSGYDPKDSTSANKPVPNFEAALTGEVKGLKIGIPKSIASTECRQKLMTYGLRA